MRHWATKYIGTPWALGATGPAAYDCWNFTRVVMREQFSVIMPEVVFDSIWQINSYRMQEHAKRSEWVEQTKPQEGDVVLMARSKLPVHIGVWINANGTQGVLHCLERVGVHFTAQSNIRASGWGLLEYYRHTSR